MVNWETVGAHQGDAEFTVLILPLRNSSFTDTGAMISNRPSPASGRRGEGQIIDQEISCSLMTLNFLTFEMSFRAALRLLTPSRVMDSSVSQEEFFSC